ncbi:restriction endonuclease subunit S [Streptococcus pneumoniae]|uniref:restriction endonuclease subunit S n=1 Tax=Streptococcus pneumoniae TaxID=1313 RepID=UPI000254C4C9|nr:restriction endonuclease subunit S [Streptococcus pneumoniae]EHZ79285.1 type I restriction modification DNA specificity domain protein [Streptococcus pneumoniae 7879-04]EHZ30860.1 type I restriction modification DNA specificity domain protein [Streptococcus pneumoniae GA17719]EIA06196.1 type I restriction modification DNA specificity domain protein [Streptococcus pneumoniae GA08825]KAA3419587.1 restriction endonuclease subunit S [Streptococcus pneumoniae]MBW5018535.1 restriction endonucleas
MKKVKLGEVCEILSGYAFKSSQFNDNKIGLPLIRIRDVERGFSDTYFEGTYPEEYLIKNGDLLITMDGSFILKKWEGDLALLNQRVCKIKITDKSVDEGYISWLIPKFLKEIEDKTPFVTVKHLSVAKIKDISFVLPNKLEQKLIAKKLNTISQIYDFRKIQSEKFNELVKSRFNEMFGDVILNEKEWKVSKWNEILTIRNGKNQKQVEDADGKFPIYGSGGIMGYAKDWIVKKNSVIIGRKGNINKPILVRENFWNVDTAFGLEPVLEKINSEYLFYFCQLYNFEKLNKAVTIPSLTKSDLLNISIPLPPLALQNEFADFVALVDKSQLAIQKSLEELETLKKSLMQEYFG